MEWVRTREVIFGHIELEVSVEQVKIFLEQTGESRTHKKLKYIGQGR